MSEIYRELGGGIADSDDTPSCSWRCDGMGYDRHTEPRTRGPVPCPIHWPDNPAPIATRRRRHLRVSR